MYNIYLQFPSEVKKCSIKILRKLILGVQITTDRFQNVQYY